MNIPTKRWRGYYRALKRGESWAVEFSKKSPLNQLFQWVYREELLEKLVHSENPLLKLIGPRENSYHQPVTLGIDFTLKEFIDKTTKE